MLVAVVQAQTPLPVAAPSASAAPAEWLLRELHNSPVLRQHHVGFQLTDVATGQPLTAWQADKYFVPASTHKLLTLYAALRILPDSVPALQYVVHGDSLIFRGTGDPTLLHGDVPSRRAYDLLKRWQGRLYYAETPAAEPKFGPGWSWDDYPYYFQPERSTFPIYGNVVRFKYRQPGQPTITVQPRWFAKYVKPAAGGATSPDHVARALEANRYTWYPSPRSSWTDESPFRTSRELLLTLLRDTLKRKVRPAPWRLRPTETPRTYYSLGIDSLLRRTMRVSDNLLAEQTLLLCSSQLGHDSLSVARVIAHARKQWLLDLPDSLAWVDGSGLSRQNLTTPRNQVALLLKLHRLVPEARLFDLLAAGGRQGTLRRVYRDPTGLWLWGKTGTLTNAHNLCGFLRTRSGQLLAFSFMNNNHLAGSPEIRNEMERVLTLVRERL
ncbi:D-alanyl-D-alanine carboxypeptidase/D-alanyl-D-alanine-endopeptidase [Hymenobacter oligotrophus]|uniref:D-alanyl-D-alanine carboxypeptidase/D-alanyl-D-alanine-endopeptidase n=1 Tax=Hymenobacter oligotrophus TaxID=2319843 RepID=UPI0013C2F10B|nr:D-alanyl-D-alanine carboxypeptidase [Hymenobacter oligotrophus]